MRVLATYSIKGGVGKTSAAVNLATTAADRGHRVLLWDLDPQGGATFLFRVESKVKGGARALVSKRRPLLEVIRGTDVANLDLVPSDFRYRHLDLLLDKTGRPTRRLGQLISAAADEYDVVFLDCAPSASLVSEAVLDAADTLVVPVIPSALSARTVDQLVAFVDDAPRRSRPQLFAFLSMVDRRRRLHRELVQRLPELHRGSFASTVVPSAAIIERMGSERRPIARYAPRSSAAQAYDELWTEIEARSVAR